METTSLSRLGFHYYPDTLHYRDSDLQRWLPELTMLGASWLVLQTPLGRAIPEAFLTGLISAGIQPVLHIPFKPDEAPEFNAELKVILETYCKWGVRYILLSDRPNSRMVWQPHNWGKEDLVERFLDRFIPIAEQVLQCGMIPVFPPLVPGGSYWDTSFLKSALLSLVRRQKKNLLDNLLLSAYAWTADHSLNWGAGGADRWPGARPYWTPPLEEDQQGFRIFDWYQEISRSVLQRECSILVLGCGSSNDPQISNPPVPDPQLHAQNNLLIAQLVHGETVYDPGDKEKRLDPLPSAVKACCYWLLAAEASSGSVVNQAWFQPGGNYLPAVSRLRQYLAEKNSSIPAKDGASSAIQGHPIGHYLLLPQADWGISEFYVDVIKPYIRKYKPTVGFSMAEARLAARVTVVGEAGSFSDEELLELRHSGCMVEQIQGDGMTLASLFAER